MVCLSRAVGMSNMVSSQGKDEDQHDGGQSKLGEVISEDNGIATPLDSNK